MDEEQHSHSKDKPPHAILPLGAHETLEQFIERSIETNLRLHQAKLDLEYRTQKYRELRSRLRANGTERADLKRQMQELSLPRHLVHQLDNE